MPSLPEGDRQYTGIGLVPEAVVQLVYALGGNLCPPGELFFARDSPEPTALALAEQSYADLRKGLGISSPDRYYLVQGNEFLVFLDYYKNFNKCLVAGVILPSQWAHRGAV